MTSRLKRRIQEERGIAMVLVVIIAAMLSLMSVYLIDSVRAESDRGAHANWSSSSFQAAEAGLDEYVSKLVDDHIYYLHFVHPGESTRSPSAGITVGSSDCYPADPKDTTGVAWAYSKTWTYPSGKDHWCSLPNGFEYNLQISPPGTVSNPTTSVRIVSTGRKAGSTTDMRAVESYVRPSNLADFYRFSDGDVSIDAETFGKIYSNGDVNHTGTAHADIYAMGSVTGSPTMVDGAIKYQNGNFGTPPKVKNTPIDFSKFLVSLVDIKRAAEANGAGGYLNQAGKTAWRIIFNADGSYSTAPCTGSNHELGSSAPACSPTTTYPSVPSNGAIYTDVTAIVSGVVDGRVTVGAGQNIVVAGNVGPETPGDDVLGLVAYSDLWVAEYAPDNLNWTAAVLVETNTWHSAGGSHGSGSLMTFTGSSATAKGGSFGEYDSRIYAYDPNLQFLPPPWFPAVDDSYTVTLFREVKP